MVITSVTTLGITSSHGEPGQATDVEEILTSVGRHVPWHDMERRGTIEIERLG
jgi:hypothetical protein